MTGTAGQMRVPKSFLTTAPIPLPPTREQYRIVAKIEELYTQLDAGMVALITALTQLQRYRQSVLKAAFEGKLTEEWRKRHPDAEPVRLDVKKERMTTLWDTESENTPNIEITELPPKWRWYSLDDLSLDAGYGT